jgi:flagellar biosynthesis/type III secretory pathway protein FliH
VIKALKDAVPVSASAAASAGVQRAVRVVKRDVLLAREEAERIVAAARTEAERVLAAGHAAGAAAFEQARQAGRDEGIALASKSALEWAKAQAASDAEALQRSIAVARALTERLVAGEFDVDSQTLGRLALAALAEVRSFHAVQFRCHPADVDVIAQAFSAAGMNEAAVRVIADGALQRGDFVLQTPAGRFDASLRSRLDLLCRALLDGASS